MKVIERIAKKFSIVIEAYMIGPSALSDELMGIEDLGIILMVSPPIVYEFLDFVTQVKIDFSFAFLGGGADK
ncbi:MAG: hypothetical protein ACUVR0_09800 [Candidatus Aminicenantales bacterium]